MLIKDTGIFWIGGADMIILGTSEKLEQEITQIAKKHGVKKVILFGSRARGDYKKTSDIDLAVSGGNYSSFAAEVDEVTSTLLKFDVVNLDGSVQSELLDSIRKEGKVLYEKV